MFLSTCYCLGNVYPNLNVFPISLYSSCGCYLYSCFSVEERYKVAEELKKAETVVLTYACDRPETLDSLSTYWLPHLRDLEVLISPLYVFASEVHCSQLQLI